MPVLHHEPFSELAIGYTGSFPQKVGVQLMGPPECSRYEVTLALIRRLIATDRAIKDLRRYLTSFRGAKFDVLANRRRPDEFTSEDFLAVRKLNVSVLRTARQSLLGEAKPEVWRLLRARPRCAG